ncbi:hypothetical protein Tpau_0159 [Tsukamurella paurometabola DSM 20162]|uniref:Uncharacterized protein n=2 Tax=Tsukamurella paurometabola TaxID=2061 RepID=D5UQ45_TSUPD|nr:hypothetical protein Tpau_0159 [Tsukamurella paurometabola DSM 20162]
MPWERLDEFIDTMEYWTEVQNYLESIEAQRATGTRLVAFGRPYLKDENTLILPNGPARDQMDDGEILLSITRDDDGYSLRRTGYERGDTFTGRQEWKASNFDLVGKYVLVRQNSRFRTKIGVGSPFHQWLDIGLASQWEKRHMSQDEVGVDWLYKYTNSSSPSVYYYDYDNGDPLTFPFSLSYRDITDIYMKGVPQPH